MVSELYDPEQWEEVESVQTEDLTYHRGTEIPAVRIAFDRPEVRNAFRPQTVDELARTLRDAKARTDVACVLLTGNGPSPKDGGWAFSAGGDQAVRSASGYQYEPDDSDEETEPNPGRLHVLEVQRAIRMMPKPVIAVVPGWAVGGGHSLHVVCDLTIASDEHAKFLQTDPDVASFDAGYGSAYLAQHIGQKRAREIFFLGKSYSATEAAEMGMVNEVVAHDRLEATALEWAGRIARKSPMSIRMIKFSCNAVDDGMVGQQVFAGEATRLGYMTEEAEEGRDAFLEDRDPAFDRFPWYF